MGIALLTLAALAASHTVQLDHHGATVDAVYSTHTDIKTRTIGAHTPNRMDGRRCLWTATVSVDRQLSHAPVLKRKLAPEMQLSGSESGACSRDTQSIERQVATRGDKIKAHLMVAIEQDRTQLLAELDSVKTMASN